MSSNVDSLQTSLSSIKRTVISAWAWMGHTEESIETLPYQDSLVNNTDYLKARNQIPKTHLHQFFQEHHRLDFDQRRIQIDRNARVRRSTRATAPPPY